MKSKFTLFGLFLIGGLLFTSSCKKEAENIVDSITKNISVNIDGDYWKTEVVTTTKTGGKYVITAIKGDETLMFSLTDVKVGKYPIDVTDNTALFTTGSDPATDLFTGTGEVEITAVIKDGKEFEGKFNLIAINAAANTKIFTNGTMTNIQIP